MTELLTRPPDADQYSFERDDEYPDDAVLAIEDQGDVSEGNQATRASQVEFKDPTPKELEKAVEEFIDGIKPTIKLMRKAKISRQSAEDQLMTLAFNCLGALDLGAMQAAADEIHRAVMLEYY